MKEAIVSWKQLSALQKYLSITVLALVVFAYLPTLQFDYVTQDQWRAFRYSSNEISVFDRVSECSSMISLHYVQTGRPFVWPTECIEHAFVRKISDFKYLRPLALLVVVFTVIYLASTINAFAGGVINALVISAIFVTAPAYSFMYLQGLPALMVLISIIFAAGSYKYHLEWRRSVSYRYKPLIESSLLFLAACMIYPAFAFIVLPLALINFSSPSADNTLIKAKQLSVTLIYYGALSGIYYLLTKLSISALAYFQDDLPNLGRYEVSVNISPTILFERMSAVANYVYKMAPLNTLAFHGASFAIVAAFSILVSYQFFESSRNNSTHNPNNTKKLINVFSLAIALLVLECGVLLMSASPWFLSKMTAFPWESESTAGLQTRHLLPIYLFASFAFIWVIKVVLYSAFRPDENKLSIAIIILVLVPISVVQNRNSFLEVASTRAEIEVLRGSINQLKKNGGLTANRFILVIRPDRPRPIGIENLLNVDGFGNDNAVLASSKNPVSIPWMINAVIRETFPDLKINVTDCGFDTESCVSVALANPRNIVVAYAYGRGAPKIDFLKSQTKPYVINISELTSNPLNPTIKKVELPNISATSTLDDYGPQGLFIESPPGWHAKRNPEYPQTLNIDLKEQKSFKSILFLPQDNALIARMPKSVHIKTSRDGKLWETAAQGEDMCTANSLGGWHKLIMPGNVETRYLKIDIISNCGDPDFLTLRGLKIE